MRTVPASMTAAWNSGLYIGDQQPMVRATLQVGGTYMQNMHYNTYASTLFGATRAPREMPNVKSVQWSRSTDQDTASMTMVLYNTKPLPLGTTPTRDLDLPGYYTYNRGQTSFANRWGQHPNEWGDLLVPDNIIRTYEGYGFDETKIPELDPHLVSSGVWRIDEVEYTHDGLITVTCRDIGSILIDQIIFAPIVPNNFYPLYFSAVPNMPGVPGSYTWATPESLANSPTSGPTGTTSTLTGVTSGDASFTVHVDGGTPATTATWHRTGFRLEIDEILDPVVHSYDATTFTGTVDVTYSKSVLNGNVYKVRVRDVWYNTSTKKTQVAYAQVGELFAYPVATSASAVTVGSVSVNPTAILWGYTGTPDKFTIIAFLGSERHTFTVNGDGTGTQSYVTDNLDLTQHNILVFPTVGTANGAGDFLRFDAWYAPPVQPSSPPLQPSAPAGPTVKSKSGKVVPLKPKRVALKLSDSSNTYYEHGDKDAAVYGHQPDDAFDSSTTTYWLSIGNARADQGYSYEWIEGSVPNLELTQIRFTTALTGYFVYVSVFANGHWTTHNAKNVVPYDAKNPESHNGSNIPYLETVATGKTEGPHIVTFATPVKNVTKVRLTFHNLQYFSVGTLHYRAGVRNLEAYAAQPATATKTPTKAKPGSGAGGTGGSGGPVDPNAGKFLGAGETPGKYQDYTDIVKLLCAWGGFFWPYVGQLVYSDGTDHPVTYPQDDPVLGVGAGRVWGDFEDTGTAGIADLPVEQWDKKSLMDGINFVRDIIGFVFYIDEDGAVVWRSPNVFSVGNYKGNRDPKAGRTPEIVTIDERVTLMGLRAKLAGRNVRERVFVASTDGKTGALAKGYNPNPIGLRRVGGWTDQHFGTKEECLLMADLISLRALMTYRTDSVTIPGNPAIQIDDQVRIFEQVTGEGFLHYVKGISSNIDLESGVWTYTLDTQWLGERPFDKWIFNPANMSEETQLYLDTQLLTNTDFGSSNG